jgi:hypothetical protein
MRKHPAEIVNDLDVRASNIYYEMLDFFNSQVILAYYSATNRNEYQEYFWE